MKRVFITGIAGFIGFHLASTLARRGDYVIGCDNFNNYYTPFLKKQRAALLKQQGVHIINQDITSLSSLNDSSITHIVHLAAQAGVRYSITHPMPYAHTNLTGFLNILELARHIPNVKLIFASSSSVYGNQSQPGPCAEIDPTDSPISLYGATKKAGELLAKSYHSLYKIPMTGLRFFTVYGPWGRPDMAYYSFANNILNQQPINVFNHGKMNRDFTYIDDIINGIVASLERCNGYNIYNLGNHQPQPLMTLIQLLETHLNQQAIINYLPMQQGDVTTTYANIEKAQYDLNFHPNTSLQTGIAKFSQWFLTHDHHPQTPSANLP